MEDAVYKLPEGEKNNLLAMLRGKPRDVLKELWICRDEDRPKTYDLGILSIGF